jgi:hypothetical protein
MNSQRQHNFHNSIMIRLVVTLIVIAHFIVFPVPVSAQEDNPNPPDQVVKLIFIHHSTGENLLRDGYGNLGRTLGSNNYFVSDTNYGWGPDGIGDRTDIVNWPEWFGGERSEPVLKALFSESNQNSGDVTRTLVDPGGENTIIMFKSCFPNSDLSGNPTDPPSAGVYDYTVGSAKFIYNSLLEYFASRPDKMFVVITAPPLSDATHALNARSFNNWLMTEWLKNYTGKNVFVFDFYNILTGANNHHRYTNGKVEWINNQGGNTSYYPSSPGDDHPNVVGSQKATDEFLPLLNLWYHQWIANVPPTPINPQPTVEQEEQPTQTQPSGETSGEIQGNTIIEDFEESGLSLFPDVDSSGSTVSCSIDRQVFEHGEGSLHIAFSLVAQGYVGCGRPFETPQNLSAANGITMSIRTDQPTIYVTARVLSNGVPYEAGIELAPDRINQWGQYYIAWNSFIHASWDSNEAPSEVNPTTITDISISLGSDNLVTGNLWVDNISLANDIAEGQGDEIAKETPLTSATEQVEATAQIEEDTQIQPTEQQEAQPGSKPGICSSAVVLIPIGLLLRMRSRKR